MIRRIGRFLSGLTTLLLSFFLAVIIWITANQAEDPTIIKPIQIPVSLTIPSDTALIEPSNRSFNVTITVEGRASLLDEIDQTDFTTSVDLSQIPLGESQTVPVVVQPINNGVTITSQTPARLDVYLEQLITREIEVDVEIRGQVARGHSQGPTTVNPQQISVTGVASVVNALDRASVTVFLNNNRETLIESRPPIFYDRQGQVASVRSLSLSSRDVEVTIPVTEAADFAEKIITIDLVGQPAEGYRVLSLNVEPSAVLVQGRPTQLNNLSQVTTEPIDITGLTESFVTPASLALPDGVELDELTEITVTVEIAPFQGTLTLNREVEVLGLDETLTAELSDNTVRVVLFGPSPVLDSLSESEVVVSLDLFGLDVGEHPGLEPTVSFPDRGLELRSIDPLVITAVISETEESELNTPRGTTTPNGKLPTNTQETRQGQMKPAYLPETAVWQPDSRQRVPFTLPH